MKILITRSISKNLDLFVQIKGIGHEPILLPILEVTLIETILTKDVNQYKGLIITSVNALPAISNINKDIKIFILGKAAFKEFKENGFINSVYAGQNVLELKEKIKNLEAKYLYLSARDITDDLSEFKNVTRKIVYEANFIEANLAALVAFIKLTENRACIFFSVRAAKKFLSLLKENDLMNYTTNLTIFCLSEKIADILKPSKLKVYFSKNPDSYNLIELIKEKVP